MRDVEICLAHEDVSLAIDQCRQMVHTLDQHPDFDCPKGVLSLAIVTDEEIARIHQEFLQDPSPTDVITFPGDPEEDYAGEILVSADTAKTYASKHNLDFSRELTLYLVHGYLHLCGWDDRKSEDRTKMKEAEQKALLWLEEQKAIPAFHWKKKQSLC